MAEFVGGSEIMSEIATSPASWQTLIQEANKQQAS